MRCVLAVQGEVWVDGGDGNRWEVDAPPTTNPWTAPELLTASACC